MHEWYGTWVRVWLAKLGMQVHGWGVTGVDNGLEEGRGGVVGVVCM